MCSSHSARSPIPAVFAILVALLGAGNIYAQVSADDERVHFGDIVDVDFVGGFEFDWRGGLTPDGNLDGLDAADGPIPALCRSGAEIAADVKKAYGKILRDPQVEVRIVDRSNRAVVRLFGAVRSQARFQLMRPVHLRELLVLAGGLTDDSSGEVSIFRPASLGCTERSASPTENKSSTLSIHIRDLVSGKPDSDPAVVAGDLITVERAPVVYVIGAVDNPRPIYSRTEMTISRAVATAGGLSKDADGTKAVILRRDGTDTKPINVDLAKIKAGVSEDMVLKPFDIIDVASRGGGKRKLPPIVETHGRGSTAAEPPLRIVD
ncbi:MAG TPA: SLBB domain-containing protein [Pyrinomonadaceae bacterium]|nr:SLBB domain-containing protein [Pyrinomonadaceae bacterium]